MTTDVLVVGAGMAGLACARALDRAGRGCLVIDKGRGAGGRMATRRVTLGDDEVRFDHGAQYFTVRDPGFAALIDALPGATAIWEDGGAEPHRVGRPGMSALPRAMAEGLELRTGVEVTGLARAGAGWRVATTAGPIEAAHVVLTIPAPQAARLPGLPAALADRLRGVEMAPCLTLMAAFPADLPRPAVQLRPDTGPLGWIARDSAKPGRADRVTTWVAQATPEWSRAHLEEDRATIARRLLPVLAEAIGAAPEAALHVAGHRWRYARVTTPLGAPVLSGAEGTLHLGGDWALGARVEAAWQSGAAIAADLLATTERTEAPT